MSETNTESSTADSAVILSEPSSTSVLPSSSSSSPSNTVDDETKRRKILSKLWGKGNKSSQKVRELEKSTINNSSDLSIHNDNDQQQLTDNSNNLSSYSSTNDPKSTTEDSSNSINSSKPLAVVKPIVVVKSGLVISSATDRTRVNSEASSTTTTQIDETATTTVTERQSSSTATDGTSSKKKKSHKNENSKKKKATRDKSNERDRSKERHHHQKDDDSSKKSSSSSKNHRREHNEEISVNDNHHKSSHHHSSSTISSSNNRRRSPSNDGDHSNRRSSRSTISKKDEPSSSKRSTLSPVDHHHHSGSKYETTPHHHRRGSSRTHSPSSSRSRYSTTNRDRSQTKNSSSPKKDDRSSNTITKSSRQQTESVSNSKSTNSISPSDSYSAHRHHGSNAVGDHDTHRHKTRTNDENATNSSKSQKPRENSPNHRPSTSSSKQEKSKTITNNQENSSNRRKLSSSRHDRRSHSRHRSRSKEDKTNRKTIESSNSDESSINKNKTNHEKDSTTVHENSHNDKKSSRGSSIPSTNDDHRRKSSSDYHRYDRHDSPSNYDRRNDYYYHHHRHSYYPNTHYVHHHHHHHYRTTPSQYHYHRRSISPRSHQHHSRYFSSSSSSLSPSPRRRSPSRTSSSSSHSSSSYSSISRTSSSRSSSRNNHYYHHHHYHEKKFCRSPTLEKLLQKASKSIESVSTQKNPNIPSSTQLISIQTSNTNSDLQITSPMNSLSEPNTFYSESFSGFSAPPPPFLSQPQQRCLKEITTDSSTSRHLMFNEVPISTSSNVDEVIPIKTIQPTDLSNNVRSGSNKPPRISRFSDITPSVPSEPALNTNLPVDTQLNYIQISENINCLPSSRRQQKHHNREVMECECTTSEYSRSRGIKACGHECLNRMLLIECSSNCPCGQWCTNRRFQRRSYANHKLALFKTEMKGYGLRTISSIRKGRFLAEYIGEVIDMDELARRNKKYKRDGNTHQYVMSLIHGTVIDSTIKGNWARFINHSCEPNCVAEKWLVNGEYRMGIFSKRDLNINEEITIDYRFETFGTVDSANEKCYCGAPTCRGTISVKTNSNNNTNNLNKRQTRRQTLDDDELLDCLHDDETNEYIIPKTIEEIRQLIQIMSRTDSENGRTIELNLIKNSSQKHLELPRLFLECNGLHVLCSWMKDILIVDDEQQQYSDEFKNHLLDFIHNVLPIKDRTTVIKNGLLDLVYKKLKLPLTTIDNITNNDQEQINNLMNSMLNHLDDPIIAKLFHIYSTWMSLKERYIIPKRKEPQETSNYHHHHRHHHHSSKHPYEENNYRLNFSTRSSIIQQKPIERYNGRRSFVVKDIPRTQEQQLSKDERRKLFEQQYEDEEKARAAAAAAGNGESPGGQNEPPHKKQRTSDGTEAIVSNTPPELQTSSTSYPHQMDQTYWIHKHLSQIPIDYIRSYMVSIGEPISVPGTSTGKDEPPLPPPPQPDDENELSRIIRLPSGWSVAMCPSDSSVYFYNQQTMTTSWVPPSLGGTPIENSGAPLDLSPLSSAQISEQRRPHHHQQQLSSSSRSTLKLPKHPHRHGRNHRHHHYYHHHMSSNNKRKRPSETESTTIVNVEPHPQSTEETSMIVSNEQIKQEEINDRKAAEPMEEMFDAVPKVSIDENNENDVLITVKECSEIHDNIEEQNSSNYNTLSSSLKLNRDLLRKNISQHVHATLKPYTKRTCKQGRIVSTDDIKYLVKKFTLAVLDKEIEKAKNERTPLSPILTERVRLKTEVYVKKYMNKMGSVFQRHDTGAHPSSQPQPQQPTTTTTTTTSNPE